MLWPKLRHLLSQPIVHIVYHQLRQLLLLASLLASQMGLHWSHGRKRLRYHFRLKPYGRFGQQRMIDAAGTVPRLSALLGLKSQQIEAILQSTLPIRA